jgi:molybdopterin synthase sulfur carrier subunit
VGDQITVKLSDYNKIIGAAESTSWDMDSKTETTVEVTVAPPLRKLVNGVSTVQAHGETVRQLLYNLDIQFPGFKGHMIDKWGELRGSIIIYLNDENIRCLQGLETPLKDGDSVGILVVLSGG